ncbi:DUF1839 family protein [Agilicoccus flavus]|uniref:DUF1839 family protein n=1 Tax=Agilicoccus flavus TaxID=2775968 RepID=UPI001CF64875|nr:DUF1839 family protein [Agilicoccus flavus]
MTTAWFGVPPADAHRPHPLHGPDRVWAETNCYVDVWIELLSLLGLDPRPAGVAALSSDALPHAWSFLKYQVDDLRNLYGIGVTELDVWRSVEDHLLGHLAIGELLAIEADSWFLPDTAGTAYRSDHVKTTIVPLEVEPAAQRMTYLHNAGRFVLEGDDYLGSLATPGSGTHVPAPYVERIRCDRIRRDPSRLVDDTVRLARDHLERAPDDNPVVRLCDGLDEELPALAEAGMARFHLVSFATTRQLGLSAQGAADGLSWLATSWAGARGDASREDALRDAATRFGEVAFGAKNLQFGLARVARGRRRDLGELPRTLADTWGLAMEQARIGLR